MLEPKEIELTDSEMTVAANGHTRGTSINHVALRRRREVAKAQLAKALWTIVDQLRTQGTLDNPSSDDLTAAAILEQVSLIAGLPHPTTQYWFDHGGSPRIYVQTADPVVSRELSLRIPLIRVSPDQTDFP